MKTRSRQSRSNSKRRKAENSLHRDSDNISGRRVCPTNSRKRKIKKFSCNSSDIAAEGRKRCSSASYFEVTQRSAAFNFETNNNTEVSGVSVNVVSLQKSQVNYTETVTVIKKSVGIKNCRQCSECGEVALSMRTLKKNHLMEKPLCLVCWKTKSKLKVRPPMVKECFVRLTDVMKIESFRKLISHNKETFEQSAKRKHIDDTALCPHKFMQKEVGQTDSLKIVKRPRRELKTTAQECKKGISYSQKNLTDSKNCVKQDVRLLHFTPGVISSNNKSLDTSKTCAYALRHEKKNSLEMLASGSETRLKQTTRSVSSKLSVTYLKPKLIVPYTCSICSTIFSQLMDGKVHELKHSNRFPVVVLKRCKMPSSLVSFEANESGNVRQIDGPDGSEAQDTGSTGVNSRGKHNQAIQVNFADESEAQQTGSTGVNTRSKHDKVVQVNFSDEKENKRCRQNIMDNKCGQEAASGGISTKNKYQEAAQINFVVEKDQQGLQAVISDKNNHIGGHGGPVMESECAEAVEPGVNGREDKDTEEGAKDFNGGVALVGLLHVQTSKANKNKDDEAIIVEGIRGEFQESVQEKDEGEHSSEVHTNVQEAAGSEFHSKVQVEEEGHKRNYASEAGMNDGKEAVESEYHEDVQAHVAKDDHGGSYTNRAEINENVQTDVAEDCERHYTNVADTNNSKEAIEIEYHEVVLADVSEDDQVRACINEGKEAIENVHHGGVETDVAEDDDQRGNYTSEGDKNKGLEAVESEYYVDVQAYVAEEHQDRNYISEVIMNEGKEAVESEFCDGVCIEVPEVVVQGGNYTTEADLNIDQESVETEFYEDVKDVAEDSDRNEDQAVESEFHEDMQLDGEECGRGNYTSESYTNENQEFVSGGEVVESIFPETMQRNNVCYGIVDQREI
jgi:hypothetical protein